MRLARDAEFSAFDASHLGALTVLVVGAVVVVALGRAGRERDPGDRLGKGVAVVMALGTLPLQVLYFTPDLWNPAKTLPIQLCDLASFAAIYALWTHRWWATGLVYYWGLTLTIQAIITPDLDSAFPDPVFVLFWVMHIGTVWAALYLTFGRGVRPDWRSFRLAVLVTAAWAVVVFCFNVVAGTNYGFLNAKPAATTALDLLGPWPLYVVAEIAIITCVWALITWPWTRRARRQGPTP